MGGFLGIGGSSAKTDRSGELAGWANLQKMSNWAIPAGQQALSSGMQSLGSAGQYFGNILSGNRAKVSQAVAPETAAARSQSDASARQLATSGTARGGGVGATNQQRDQQLRAHVDQAIFGARPAAAQGAMQVGQAQAATGLGAGTLGEYATSDWVKTAIASRQTDLQQQNAIGSGVAKLITTALGFALAPVTGGASLAVAGALDASGGTGGPGILSS